MSAAKPYLDWSLNEKHKTEFSIHQLNFDDVTLLRHALENYKSSLHAAIINYSKKTVGDIDSQNQSNITNSRYITEQYAIAISLIAALQPPVKRGIEAEKELAENV